MRAFRISVTLMDETYGPHGDLTIGTNVVDDVPPGGAYYALDVAIQRLIRSLRQRDEERRAVRVERRVRDDPLVPQWEERRGRGPQLHGPTVHPWRDCDGGCIP